MTEIDDVILRVECKMLRKGAVVVDIGGNPSAGDGEANDDDGPAGGDAVDDGTYEVIDVVDCFGLASTVFNKKSYMGYIKDYMRAIKKHLSEAHPERVAVFEAKAIGHVKAILENFDKYEFYTGENMDPEAMAILYEPAAEGAEGCGHLIYWKDGLKGNKY